MAQKHVIELTDDLDNSEANQTVTFSMDGADYEIDLNDGNADDLRSALAGYAAKARRTGGRKQTPTAIRTAGPSSKGIRAWAVAQGMDINPRGRVPEAIIQQYLAAS
jgi:hypothetical protein